MNNKINQYKEIRAELMAEFQALEEQIAPMLRRQEELREALYGSSSHRNRQRAFVFDDVVLGTRIEADDVLKALTILVQQHGAASVADLHDLVGVTGNFADRRWGWSDLQGVSVRREHGGYLLVLPKPEPLSEEIPQTEEIKEPASRTTYNGSHTSTLVEYLKENPGSSKQQVRDAFDGKLTDRQLSNVLNSAKRRGLIENRGASKAKPAWHLVDAE